VSVKADANAPGGKVFTVSLANGGSREYTTADITHIPALSSNGIVGLSPISVARQSIGTGLAGDKAAGRMFSNGLLIGGLVTTDDDIDETQAKEIKDGLMAKVSGTNRAGDIAVVNRSLKFSPWTMPATDAQFVESRAFQVEEVARIFGLPKVLLAEDGASTWGSGIAELVRGMQRFTLAPWTARIEQRLSRLLAMPRFCEFDYAGLLAPTPGEVIQNMKAEIDAGLLTRDEGRRLLNRPPLTTTTEGDTDG
jgi:HK97 family phage portal protein